MQTPPWCPLPYSLSLLGKLVLITPLFCSYAVLSSLFLSPFQRDPDRCEYALLQVLENMTLSVYLSD